MNKKDGPTRGEPGEEAIERTIRLIEKAEEDAERDWAKAPVCGNLPTMQREYIAKAVLGLPARPVPPAEEANARFAIYLTLPGSHRPTEDECKSAMRAAQEKLGYVIGAYWEANDGAALRPPTDEGRET